MKLADYVVNFLADKGIDKIFVLYGAANGHLIDAFTRTNKTKYVATMHEQAAGFAAEGWSKIKGLPGAAIVTSGPGALNLVTPIANFFYDSVPGIFITGQINSQFLRPAPEVRQVGFQECDVVSVVKPITKYAVMVTRPRDIRFELEKAWFICRDKRPGPCVIDIPIDIQKADVDPDNLFRFDAAAASDSWDLEAVDAHIDRYIADFRNSQRPVLMIGGGVRSAGAVDEVHEIAKFARIPCFPTWNALDVVTSDFEFYGGRIGTYGGAGRNFGIQNSDLLLAIGSRISGRITGGNVSTFARGAKKYVVDVDKALLQPKLQQVPFDENIFCDARAFARRLLEKLKQADAAKSLPRHQEWNKRCVEWRTKYDPVRSEYFKPNAYRVNGQVFTHPYAFMRRLSEKMTAADVLVCDLGGTSVVVGHAFDTKSGQRYVTNNGNAPMGFAMAGAIGAWLASPDRQVAVIIGDGGFNLNIQELQTLVNYGVKIKVFILNNHIYGITKAFQETNFQGRCEACGPVGYNPPDFVKIVKAYGIEAFEIKTNADIDAVVDRVLAFDGPAVCDVNCHDYHTYEPRIFGWSTPVEDMYPYLPRDEFQANLCIEPYGDWQNPEMPDITQSNTAFE